MPATTTKDDRLAFVAKLRFETAVWDHMDKLTEAWADSDARRPLSRGNELLRPAEIHRSIVQWCLNFALQYYPGTMAHPVNEQHVPQLFRDGKIDLPELPYLRPYLNSLVHAALEQGRLLALGLQPDAAAFGKRCRVASDRWKILHPNFMQNSASINGELALCGIEVELASQSPAQPEQRNVPRAELKKWIENHVKERAAAGLGINQNEAETAAREELQGNIERPLFRELMQERKPSAQRGRRGRPPKKLASKIGG